AVGHLREADRRVDHRLLVARQIAADAILRLEQRLADAGDVAMAEDREHAAEERLLDAVEAGVLLRQALDQRLRHGQASGLGHGRTRDLLTRTPMAGTVSPPSWTARTRLPDGDGRATRSRTTHGSAATS